MGSKVSHSSNTDNMKFLVLAACVAVSTASLVTFPNGAVVPADTPAVALARAAHFTSHGAAYIGAVPYAYGVPGALVTHANGAVVPVDEPAVAAAKADHFAAHGYPAGVYAAGAPYLAYAGLVGHANGAVVPVEPADVLAARADHLAAHAAA